jgi:hypothetical protein
MDFVVSPPSCGRSATDFWGWDAHEAQLHCPDEVYGDTWIWSIRRGLNLSPTKLPRPWSPWESSPSRKNPHSRTGNRTWDLMISSQKLWPLDHEAGLINPSTPELNPSAQRCLARFFTGDFASLTCISLIYAWNTNKDTNYSFSLLIMYASSYMFRHYIAIFRVRS